MPAQRPGRSAAALLALALPAAVVALLDIHVGGAADPGIKFQELMAGANGDARIQFIEIVTEGQRQTCWGPQVAPGTPGADSNDSACHTGGPSEIRSRNALIFFDAQGRETGRYKFPSNPAEIAWPAAPSRQNRSRSTTGAQIRPRNPQPNNILIATEGFAQLPGAPAPDFVMPPLLNAIDGKVCFVGNTEENRNATPINLCVSYGAYAGDTEGAGAPAAPLPLVDTVSLRRTTNGFENRNASFSTVPKPAPVNQAGRTLTIPVTTKVAQGETLFNKEPFGGNGRTCADCHTSETSGRLAPSDVQARFRAVSTTFDTLFVGETAATGFDFNLNTLTIAARPTPASGTDFLNPSGGDLRGIVTSAGGGRAKVLARTGATVYLVYGGMAPRLSGTVTDAAGNTATVVNVVPGGLNSLEMPRMMRSSRSTAMPQGRALILENIDGFANPPVFRKSPHILNLNRTAPFGFNGASADLQSFTLDAVRQHFPRTLARAEGGPNPDFRMPTADELVAMEAFQLAQEFPAGNDPDKFDLDRYLRTPGQRRGRDLFFGVARCSRCHGGPVLATTTVNILGQGIGVNATLNTGVAGQSINGAALDNLPCEPAGRCGTREFNVPQLFNIANFGPYFHDGSAATLRDVILFYATANFAFSPAGSAVGIIALGPAQISDLIEFLEGISAPSITAAPLTGAGVSGVSTVEGRSTGQGTAAAFSPALTAGGSPRVAQTRDGVRLTVTPIASGLSEPTDLAVAPDGRIFIAERAGHIRVVLGDRLMPVSTIAVPDVNTQDGGGLLAVTLDPDFARTASLFALYTTAGGFELARFKVRGDTIVDRVVLMDRIATPSSQPAAALRFGPDHLLYAAIDDGGNRRAAGDPGSYSGKVLRLNADATTPRTHVSGSPVYAIDIGRPNGLDWDGGGTLWVTESNQIHGVVSDRTGRGMTIARYVMPDGMHTGPVSIYRSTRVPQLTDNLLLALPDGRGLLRVQTQPGTRRAVIPDEPLLAGVVDGVRMITATPEGVVYVCTADTLVRIDALPPQP